MKIYLVTDLEGTAGVARWDQTGSNSPGYAQAVRLMTGELRACVAGIQAAAPDAEIWVWDGHGCGSIDLERFPRGARLLNNGPIVAPYYLDDSFDALFFLAQHAMAGTRAANLAHSYSSETIERITINGREMGELGCRAALAGSLGVPTIFASGDDKLVAEARALVPGIYTAQVKTGLAPQMAVHLAPEDAQDVIRAAAAEATAHAGEIAPFVLPGPPYEQEIVLWGRSDPEWLLRMGFRQMDARHFIKTAQHITELFV